MFGKSKKQIAELKDNNRKLVTMNIELNNKVAKLETVNKELNRTLDGMHKELAEALKAADTNAAFKDAFEGSLAGINSLLEDEAYYHKRQTEYMRGLKAAKAALEVYADAK